MSLPYARITYWPNNDIPMVEIWTPELDCEGRTRYVHVIMGNKPEVRDLEEWDRVLASAVTFSMTVLDHAPGNEWTDFGQGRTV